MQSANWSEEVRNVRILGQPIRFSNRVHSMFTDQDTWWCFPCGNTTGLVNDKCGKCGSSTVTMFNHVGEFEVNPNWPTVWLLDPHPRKPHMFAWWQVSPQDDLVQVMEGECEGDPTQVAEMCAGIESGLQMDVKARYIDPNMGRSPASSKRDITWQDEFDAAGLRCDLAEDSDVGRKRIDVYLKPDPSTQAPRIHISNRGPKTIHQLKRYVWDDYKKSLEKSQKQTPKDKNDDFPTLMKYLLNTDPTFHFFNQGALFMRRMKTHVKQRRVAGSRM